MHEPAQTAAVNLFSHESHATANISLLLHLLQLKKKKITEGKPATAAAETKGRQWTSPL